MTPEIPEKLSYPELCRLLKEIESNGWVKTHRAGPTGIGKTLEDLLGIQENNVHGPDGEDWELKSARKNASSMLTLFTKSPLPPAANSILVERFGYSATPTSRKELHTTLNATTFNSLKGNVGLKVQIKNKRIEIVSEKLEVLGYWDEKTLKRSFERKLPKLVYVKADSRGKGEDEEFLFDEAWVLSKFSFGKFLKLLEEGVILIDIRIGQYPDGRPHDHGTGFRIQPSKLDLCFSNRTKII